jgi:ubiquinone/menaquinone biosynthesis C-methylase UbiE
VSSSAAPESAKKRSSRRHFDQWSRRYEEEPVSRFIAGIQTAAFEDIGLSPDDRFLDVGCGSGAAVRRAAGIAQRAVGVDLSPGMLARARDLAGDVANVEFVEGDAEALPFADGEFTAVLCTTSFHHYPDPAAAAREMGRVLEPGGRLAIGDGCSDNPIARAINLTLRVFERSHVSIYSSARLRGFVEQAGLTHVKTRFLYRRGYQICEAHKVLSA